MRARIIITIAILSVSTAQAYQGGQPTVDDILKKVSDTYQNLKSCRFVAASESQVAASEEDAATSRDVGGNDQSRNYGGQELMTSQIELAAVNPSKFRLKVKDVHRGQVTLGSELQVLSDGQTTWSYLPWQKEYTENSGPLSAILDAPAANAQEARTIRQYWNLLVGRFRNLAQFSATAKLGKPSRISIGGHKIECFSIKLQTEGTTDEMWVDKDRFIVWRLKQMPKGSEPGSAITVNLTEAEMNSVLDDGLFRFTPPENARKVAALKWGRK